MARVLLVFGGKSAEHEVSCVSGVAIAAALEGAGHDVTAVGIDRSGGWHLAAPGSDPLRTEGPLVEFTVPEGRLRGPEGSVEFDVVFPVLHGPFGEDGTLQGMLDMAGVRYVGSGVLGSALGMEKDIAKRLFRSADLPTTRYAVVRRPEWGDSPGSVVARLIGELDLPVFVKPAAMGSSIGVAKAHVEHELKAAIEDGFDYGNKVLVEEAVVGREIEVGVLEGPRMSLPGEIVIKSEWYDYDAKYVDDSSQFVAPAALTTTETTLVQELAGRAFTALECRGLARVDFFYEEGGRGFLINELNTMPGFTPISGFPKMWEASGMSYDRLCDELIRIALG